MAMAITSSTPRKDREQAVSLLTVSPIRTQIMTADMLMRRVKREKHNKKKQPSKCESTGPVKAKQTLNRKG